EPLCWAGAASGPRRRALCDAPACHPLAPPALRSRRARPLGGMPARPGHPYSKGFKNKAHNPGIMHLARIASAVSLVFGVLFYLASVGGLLWHAKSPPGDVGLVSTTGV